jgi:hypothetical protein
MKYTVEVSEQELLMLRQMAQRIMFECKSGSPAFDRWRRLWARLRAVGP